jgi:hypothetical protein
MFSKFVVNTNVPMKGVYPLKTHYYSLHSRNFCLCFVCGIVNAAIDPLEIARITWSSAKSSVSF